MKIIKQGSCKLSDILNIIDKETRFVSWETSQKRWACMGHHLTFYHFPPRKSLNKNGLSKNKYYSAAQR
jgi:hypothetical protein